MGHVARAPATIGGVHVQFALGLLVVVLAAGALLAYAFARRTGPSRRRQAEHDERMARAAEAFRRMPRRDDQSERDIAA